MKIYVASVRPADEVRRLVRYACRELEPGVKRLLYVEVGDALKHVSGSAGNLNKAALWPVEWKRVPKGMVWRIRCAVPPDDSYPIHVDEHGILVWIHDWREALVWVTAHEAKHVERDDAEMGNGYAGEAACDAYAAWLLNEWRDKVAA